LNTISLYHINVIEFPFSVFFGKNTMDANWFAKLIARTTNNLTTLEKCHWLYDNHLQCWHPCSSCLLHGGEKGRCDGTPTIYKEFSPELEEQRALVVEAFKQRTVNALHGVAYDSD
jgi:hypothetical protein